MGADTRPAVERGLDIERCLSFEVRGDWAHFRRVDGNVVKQTYRVMPRTTIAGLIAAICGLPRDSYYDLFAPDSSALAVEPLSELRTMNVPEKTLNTSSDTDKGGLTTYPEGRGKKPLTVTFPNFSAGRQRHNYEFLVEPAYRIDCWLADDDAYHEVREYLTDGRSEFAPSLGLSECLASIRYRGEYDVERTDERVVDSAVPRGTGGIAPTPGVEYGMERSPGFMTAETENGRTNRTTTGFIDWTYAPQGGQLETTCDIATTVDGRTVVFV